MTTFDLDLAAIPWSQAGSSMALSTASRPDDFPGAVLGRLAGVDLLDVSGRRLWRQNAVFRLQALHRDDAAHDLSVQRAGPALLVLGSGGRELELTWDGPDVLRIRGSTVGLRLQELVDDPFDSAVALPDGDRTWRLQMGEDAHFAATALAGTLRVEAPRVRTGRQAATHAKVIDVIPDAGGSFELALTLYESGWIKPKRWRPFDDCVVALRAEVSAFAAGFLPAAPALAPTAALAQYVLWTSTVRPRGLLRRPSILMSKNWMNAVWSWDHCFNAIGLAEGAPGLAWDQFMIPFDLQNAEGALPDLVHDSGLMWGFVKPPVHGWALRRLQQAGAVTRERLAEVFEPLERWTTWWLTYRDLDGDGLCEYFHGNDSGQDNSTSFDAGFPATGPDLAAFLVVQMDVLAGAAEELGRPQEAVVWQARADEMLRLLLDRLWDGESFRVLNVHEGTETRRSSSQLPFLPLVLGDRLPREVRLALVNGLRTSGLLTEVGVASESISSPLHEADGYWRGPVWAPTTHLIADGLAACGERELAAHVADAYLRTCTASGFAENYDATTGVALRDPAYTWSAGVFLTFARGL